MAADSGPAPRSGAASAPPLTGQKVTLHLGVLVQPYRAAGKKSTSLTTGDVATILEAKYGLWAAFAKAHERDIANDVENSLGGALESLLMGRSVDPWGSACQSIQHRFVDFISSREAERVGIPGTPTLAAINGVSHRFKHPYARSNPRRPSFRDTGLMMISNRVWVD